MVDVGKKNITGDKHLTSTFTKTLYAFLDCSIRTTCPAHLSRLDLRLLIMLGEEYNACS